ncbi:hypothetical protein FIBSPDRAFT_937619 [Athelia psychrophila]|uniref:Uncharacterized protein n=1 Tax=Athelia psychrophila TaxID=1759441 RepID=A0A166A3T5_9AGAM|nr:hypothetical protein FIBSPDRAFT_937619 [Fibularhizoctonia sp. CBS 109695]
MVHTTEISGKQKICHVMGAACAGRIGFTKSQISTPGSSFEITYYSQNRNRVRFPDDARGFLYLHSPAEEPKAKWEIRFCITNTDNNCPSSFKSGLDLLFPNQTPWAISLSSTKARSHPLRELLIREGLDIDALAHIPAVKTRFCLNFKNTTFQPIFISFGGEEKLDCYIEFLSRHRGPSPYIGSAWCCFEAHSSPGTAQPARLVIRILEMITPITVVEPEIARRFLMPQEGKLLMKYRKVESSNRQEVGQVQTLGTRPLTLGAKYTAHPIVQAILRGTNTKSAA